MDGLSGLSTLRARFGEITGLPVDDWATEPIAPGSPPGRADAVLVAGGLRFAVEYKPAADSASVLRAVERARRRAEHWPDQPVIPLVVVPYMGEAGREICRRAGMPWLDLSGNAEIVAPGMRLRILGEPNEFKRSGRPESLFAPRSARLARVLLADPSAERTMAELAAETGLSQGFLSRLLRRYEEAEFVARRRTSGAARYAIHRPADLLDAWRAEYRFDRHRVLRGHVAERTGPELFAKLAARLTEARVAHAATGLAAAWLYAPIANFRTVTVYLRDWPSSSLLQQLRFHQGERGSNTWLVLPNDDGIWHGSREVNGIACVCPAQVYLDLAAQPERAGEAAEALRRELRWADAERQVT